LALSGGGANGAYEVGAIQHLASLGIRYDAICGTSVGALNGAFLAQFPDDAFGAVSLQAFWHSLKGNQSIYRKWPLWPISVWGHQSVYDTAPLKRLVEALDLKAVKASGKKLRVVAVAWGAGESKSWTERDDDLRLGVLASSSFPIMFPPVVARDVAWTDGGLRQITPLREAVRLGADTVDVIVCSPRGVGVVLGRRISILTQLSRLLEILLDEIQENDLVLTRQVNTLAGAGLAAGKRQVKVNVLRPSVRLGDSLDFDPVKTRRLIAMGRADARKVWAAA
jgi:NTE family protein